MTDAEFEQYVRTLVNEPISKFWTSEDIEILKKVGIIHVINQFWHLLYPTHKTYVDKGRTSGDPYIELPSDCFKIGKIEIASTGEVFHYISNENALARFLEPNTAGTPVGWIFENNKIRQIPTPNTTDANYYRIWYMPKLTSLSVIPEELHPLIAVEAVLGAKIKDEDVTSDLIVLQRRFFDAALNALGVSQLQAPDYWSDYSMEELEDT